MSTGLKVFGRLTYRNRPCFPTCGRRRAAKTSARLRTTTQPATAFARYTATFRPAPVADGKMTRSIPSEIQMDANCCESEYPGPASIGAAKRRFRCVATESTYVIRGYSPILIWLRPPRAFLTTSCWPSSKACSNPPDYAESEKQLRSGDPRHSRSSLHESRFTRHSPELGIVPKPVRVRLCHAVACR
jgi:hypothetical protein